jgi:Lar family restriction alleviation protein
MADLLPCSFCGSADIYQGDHPSLEAYVIRCASCGADGPFAFSAGGAADLWNTRAAADDTRNAGLLADITDAVYGKGTAEEHGYPRGLLRRVRAAFVAMRRIRRENVSPWWLQRIADDIAAPIGRKGGKCGR